MNEQKSLAALIDGLITASEECLAYPYEGESVKNPMDAIKTCSRVMTAKATTVDAEVKALEICVRYDKPKTHAQADDLRDAIRDVMIMALEAEYRLNELESKMGVSP